MIQTEIGTDIYKAASLLKNGELVAIPTETVYGLAANALQDNAVLKIYEAKNRPQFNPLIVHVASINAALPYIKNIPPEAHQLAASFWPGPLTLLLNKTNLISDLVTAGSNRVAIRIPAHPLTLQLLQEIDFPLAAPSANPSGYVSPTTAQHVYQGLKGKIPYILDGGPCPVGLESTIVGWNEEGQIQVYRLGGILIESMEEVLQKKLILLKKVTELPDAPGQLKSHYATHTPLLLGQADEFLYRFEKQKIILLNFKDYHPDIPKDKQYLLAPGGTIEEAAKNLFRVLREMDQVKADLIIAEPLPETGLGRAINDRLERAQYILK